MAYSPLAQRTTSPLPPRYPPAAAVAAVLMTRFHGTFSVVFNAINSTLPPLEWLCSPSPDSLSPHSVSVSFAVSVSVFGCPHLLCFLYLRAPPLPCHACCLPSLSLSLSISLSLSLFYCGWLCHKLDLVAIYCFVSISTFA